MQNISQGGDAERTRNLRVLPGTPSPQREISVRAPISADAEQNNLNMGFPLANAEDAK